MSATSRRTRRQANEADTQPVIHKGAEDTLVTYDTSAPSERCYSRLSGNGLLCHARKKRFQGLQAATLRSKDELARPCLFRGIHDRIAVLHAVRKFGDTLPRPAAAQALAEKRSKPPRTWSRGRKPSPYLLRTMFGIGYFPLYTPRNFS
jgi:hypothetical protein